MNDVDLFNTIAAWLCVVGGLITGLVAVEAFRIGTMALWHKFKTRQASADGR